MSKADKERLGHFLSVQAKVATKVATNPCYKS